jgi:hypothetical protein
MRAWILIVVIALAGCHSRRSPQPPGSNVGSNGPTGTAGGPWTQGAPALQGP